MTHASVFSGIGGPEVAATMLGWENLFHCEINPFGRAVLDYWYPNAKSYDDITKTDFTEWRGRVDVLTGGGGAGRVVAVVGAVLQYHDRKAAVAINDNDNEKILKAK